MEKKMKFECGKCGTVWRSEDYEEQDYAEGYNCPNCKSEDISGEDVD